MSVSDFERCVYRGGQGGSSEDILLNVGGKGNGCGKVGDVFGFPQSQSLVDGSEVSERFVSSSSSGNGNDEVGRVLVGIVASV